MDVVVVGDFDPEQLEAGVLLYLGTIPGAPAPRTLPLVEHPEKLHIEFRREKRVAAVHIDDTSGAWRVHLRRAAADSPSLQTTRRA